jgi:hypothetical protein
MENKQRKPFKDFGEYKGSGFDAVIKEILAERVKTPKVFKLKPIKEFVVKIRKDYSISNKANDNQIDDPFNSPYFDFIAEVWDTNKLTGKRDEDQEVARKFANELIETGFDVKKKKKG